MVVAIELSEHYKELWEKAEVNLIKNGVPSFAVRRIMRNFLRNLYKRRKAGAWEKLPSAEEVLKLWAGLTTLKSFYGQK